MSSGLQKMSGVRWNTGSWFYMWGPQSAALPARMNQARPFFASGLIVFEKV